MTDLATRVRRGRVVIVRFPGDKTRLALVIRSDLLAASAYAAVLLITTTLRVDMLMRVTVEPTAENGPRQRSQIVVDWPGTVQLNRVGAIAGQLDVATLRTVTQRLALALGIEGAG